MDGQLRDHAELLGEHGPRALPLGSPFVQAYLAVSRGLARVVDEYDHPDRLNSRKRLLVAVNRARKTLTRHGLKGYVPNPEAPPDDPVFRERRLAREAAAAERAAERNRDRRAAEQRAAARYGEVV